MYTVKPDHWVESEDMNVFIRTTHLKHIAADEFANHTTTSFGSWENNMTHIPEDYFTGFQV